MPDCTCGADLAAILARLDALADRIARTEARLDDWDRAYAILGGGRDPGGRPRLTVVPGPQTEMRHAVAHFDPDDDAG